MSLITLKKAAGIAIASVVAVAGVAGIVLRGAEPVPRQDEEGAVVAVRQIPRVDDDPATIEGNARPADLGVRTPTDPPVSIPVSVSGRAIDTADRPVEGATVWLLSIRGVWRGQHVLVEATTETDADGRYAIDAAMVPVTEAPASEGYRIPDIASYARFRVVASAPGYGLAWQQPESMDAVEEPSPFDLQGRIPLGRPVEMDLTFRPADALAGTVVDQDGRPLEGVEISIKDADLLDARGLGTDREFGDWDDLPGDLGRAVTGPDGRFRLDGLPSEARFWIWARLPEFSSYYSAFYAATTIMPISPPGRPDGRSPHEIYSGEFTHVVPIPVRLPVRVVTDDTGEPIPDVRVNSMGEHAATGVHSGGLSDADGRVTLALPPGDYAGIRGDPPIVTNYIRTYQRPLTVPPDRPGKPHVLRMKPGCVLIIEAVDGETDEGVPRAEFRLVPVDDPERTKPITRSTSVALENWTDEDGLMRAVLTPEPEATYFVTFARVLPPSDMFGPVGEQPAVAAEPPLSIPIEFLPGETIRLRFELTRRDD